MIQYTLNLIMNILTHKAILQCMCCDIIQHVLVYEISKCILLGKEPNEKHRCFQFFHHLESIGGTE